NVSSDYQKASNALAPKSSPKTVVVYVEDAEDVSFWHGILCGYEQQANIRFDFKPYSNDSLATGKKELRKLFDNVGEYLIICLDSDYDYLFQNHSDKTKKINENPFIFQTYAYSTENLKCYAESLKGICVQATHNTNEKIDFSEFLMSYSQIIYVLFIWNLYFYSKNNTTEFTISDFCNEVKITENPDIHENGIIELTNVETKVNNKLQELRTKFPEHEDNVQSLGKQLEENNGLTEVNAYLFIKGHTLYDNVVLRLLNKVCSLLKKEHEKTIKESSATQDVKTKKIKNYHKLSGKIIEIIDDKENRLERVKLFLSSNDKFRECFLFKKIESDIEAYLTMLT
ncbi:MAG: DUF4435 domain-containing protein, partial [Methylococcales bacterium]|nr:DUF4435 domain-containing protein [Methylococcales bacterium]